MDFEIFEVEVNSVIRKEGEAPEEEFEAIDEFTFEVDGAMGVDEANEELGIQLPDDDDFETVAGFVLDVLGHIPTEGGQFEFGNLRFEVVEMKYLKIETIRLIKPQGQPSDDESANGYDEPR